MKAFVALGSNLGEREAMIRLALDDLARLSETTLVRASSLYDTEPIGEVEKDFAAFARKRAERLAPARQSARP